MATHPCLPLWIDDYDAATAHLTPAEDGIYGRLMRLAWRTPGCSLPNDKAWIARKIRLSPAEYERIAKPVLAEFWTLQRGRFVQRRLKREYDDISRKKSGRVAAGKKGGAAKALKTKGIDPSKATVLLADTRAFPEPDPDPMREGKPSLPKTGKPARERASRRSPETEIPDGFPDAAAIAEAEGWVTAAGVKLEVAARARRFANHARTKQRRERDWSAAWRAWVDIEIETAPPAAAVRPAQVAWVGPRELWDAVVASRPAGEGQAFAISWLSPCVWQEAPIRAVISSSPTAAKKLREDVGPLLNDMGIQILERAA